MEQRQHEFILENDLSQPNKSFSSLRRRVKRDFERDALVAQSTRDLVILIRHSSPLEFALEHLSHHEKHRRLVLVAALVYRRRLEVELALGKVEQEQAAEVAERETQRDETGHAVFELDELGVCGEEFLLVVQVEVVFEDGVGK